LVVILYSYGYRKEAIYSLFFLMLVMLFTLYLKNLFHRPRPFWTGSLNLFREEDIEQSSGVLGYAIECKSGYSFPSGHTSRIAVFAGVTHYNKNPYFLLLSILVELSRIYLILHFLSDVVFGWFIGVIVGYILSLLIDKIISEKSRFR